MDDLRTIFLIIWGLGHIALFTGDMDDGMIVFVIIAVIMDILVVVGLVMANHEANEKKRIEEENKRREDLKKSNLSIIEKYKIKDSINIMRPELFKIDNRYQITEIVSAVEVIKNEISEQIVHCKSIKRKIDNIIFNSNNNKDETEQSIYLNEHLQELEKLNNEYKLVSETISKYKIELINENKEIHDSLEQTFKAIKLSKKCISPNGVLKLSKFIVNTNPRDLSLFKYKYKPIILRIDSFYFCLFSNIILVFDNNGIFSNALDPSIMSVDIKNKYETVRIVDGVREGNTYSDSDSKLIHKGESRKRWTYTRLDGGPDLRYSYNPEITIRYDEFEYATIRIKINDSFMSFNISSEKAIDSIKLLREKYFKFGNIMYDPIPNFLKLIINVSNNNENSINLFNYYVEFNKKRNIFCQILGIDEKI